MAHKPSDILVVCVLFGKKPEDAATFRTLLNEAEKVFIYDNSPSPLDNANLPSGWQYIHDASNPGLSFAYNKAAEYAKEQGISYILLTDQDTIFPTGSLNAYTEAIEKNPGIPLFIPKVKVDSGQFLSPVRHRHYHTHLCTTCGEGRIKLKEYAIINSGMLVSTTSFFKAGGYNTDVFLDFSDYQFIERLSRVERHAQVVDITCSQDFSNLEQNPGQKIRRFSLFCKSLRNFDSAKHADRFWIASVAVRRALSLSVSLKSIKPVGILLKSYF